MIPESKFIKNECVFREMGISDEVKLTKKSMVRWLALSLGLISPNESRQLILEILEVLFSAKLKGRKMTSQEIFEELKKINKSEPNQKAVYYHLLRLKEFGLLNRKNKEYFIGEENQTLSEFLKSLYTDKMEKSFSNIEGVITHLERSF
ncbi:hypothetical protein JXB01_04535 [Candidatus Micrarchaeota archaeon]|nr:hypothetical protein [Candidatus Micrarchaeota archaeon]